MKYLSQKSAIPIFPPVLSCLRPQGFLSPILAPCPQVPQQCYLRGLLEPTGQKALCYELWAMQSMCPIISNFPQILQEHVCTEGFFRLQHLDLNSILAWCPLLQAVLCTYSSSHSDSG